MFVFYLFFFHFCCRLSSIPSPPGPTLLPASPKGFLKNSGKGVKGVKKSQVRAATSGSVQTRVTRAKARMAKAPVTTPMTMTPPPMSSETLPLRPIYFGFTYQPDIEVIHDGHHVPLRVLLDSFSNVAVLEARLTKILAEYTAMSLTVRDLGSEHDEFKRVTALEKEDEAIKHAKEIADLRLEMEALSSTVTKLESTKTKDNALITQLFKEKEEIQTSSRVELEEVTEACRLKAATLASDFKDLFDSHVLSHDQALLDRDEAHERVLQDLRNQHQVLSDEQAQSIRALQDQLVEAEQRYQTLDADMKEQESLIKETVRNYDTRCNLLSSKIEELLPEVENLRAGIDAYEKVIVLKDQRIGKLEVLLAKSSAPSFLSSTHHASPGPSTSSSSGVDVSISLASPITSNRKRPTPSWFLSDAVDNPAHLSILKRPNLTR